MRELVHARLIGKTLLSEAAQCYHLTYAYPAESALSFEPGQFLSFVADDPSGKTYTRAYSIASAPRGEEFDLCVNRVEGGFFSNYLCDMQPGSTVGCHGPHGLFTLQQPLAPMLWIAGGTGIAPMRGFAQMLFSRNGFAHAQPVQVTLIYEAPDEQQHFYHERFLAIAAEYSAFRYRPVVEGGAQHATLEEAITKFTQNHSGAVSPGAPEGGAAPLAYVCGLAELVKPVRAQLLSLGWSKQRIQFERYD